MLVAQTFEGFNDLFTKAHGIEIHLNKHKKNAKVVEMGTLSKRPWYLKKELPMPLVVLIQKYCSIKIRNVEKDCKRCLPSPVRFI